MRNRSSNLGQGDENEPPFRVASEAYDETLPEKPEKNPAAVELGKLGGLKGGRARAAKLSSEQRVDIARKAAEARWKRNA